MSYLKIKHDRHFVSFCHRNIGSKDIYIYQFIIENGEYKIYSIEHLKIGNIKGTSYKYFDIYHDLGCKGDEKIYNYETNEYEEIKVPDEINERLNNYVKGFLVNCI